MADLYGRSGGGFTGPCGGMVLVEEFLLARCLLWHGATRNFELYLCSVEVFGLGSIFRRLTYVIFLHTLTYGVCRTHFVLRFNVQIR